MRSWTSERRAAVEALLLAGKTCRQVADAMGLARGSVCWGSRRYGLRPGAEPVPQVSRATGVGRTDWDESNLTERWTDRRRA